MDLTKEYQNMLTAAPKIQKLWKWHIGDYYYDTTLKEMHVAKGNNLLGVWDTTHKTGIWLPRQDQLQGILINKVFEGITMPMLAGKFWNWIYKTNPMIHSSMEMLWLQYLMHTLFSKVWTGTEWR